MILTLIFIILTLNPNFKDCEAAVVRVGLWGLVGRMLLEEDAS